MKKFTLTLLRLVLLAIQTTAVFGQHSQLTRSDASTGPHRIAFISDIGGGQSLYVVDPEKSDIKVFDKFNVPEKHRKIVHESIVFSPNKEQVVFFAAAPFNTAVSLWIAKADGSSARKLIDWKWPVYPRVVWSPAGDRLAFVIRKDNSSSVYSINSDGSDFHFVANGDNFSWSPNGHQLALAIYLPEKQRRYLQVVNIDGSNLRQVSEQSRPIECSWSPDGKRIAFTERHAEIMTEPKYDVFLIHPNGAGKEAVVENVPMPSQLAWSPDGKFLSFLSNYETRRGLYAWSIRDTSGKRLRFFSGVDAPFEWSPNSKHIAYGVSPVGIVDLNTAKSTMLLHTAGFGWPHWLPDGERLLLKRGGSLRPATQIGWPLYQPPQTAPFPDTNLYVTHIEPKHIKRLTDESLNVIDISSPPNGKVIAFVASTKTKDGNSNSSVFVIKSDGTNLRKLSVASIEPGWFAWSNDGSKIAFVKEMTNCLHCREGNFQIQIANADGSNESTLVNKPAWNFAPAWLPDGKGVMFLSNRGNIHGVYVSDIENQRTRLLADKWLTNHAINNPNYKFLWSPDATKLAITLRGGGITVFDVTKRSAVFGIIRIEPKALSWTPDSKSIAVSDLVHDQAMNSITPTYVELIAVNGSRRVKLIPAFENFFPQLLRIAWSLDGKRFACGGVVTFNADGSDRRWIVRGTLPAWVE